MKKDFTLENLKSKLKGYSALAGAIVASGTAANADMMVKDTTIALTADTEAFEIDLNCDGSADVRVQLNLASSGTYIATIGTSSYNRQYSASMSLLGNAAAMTSTDAGKSFVGGFLNENDNISGGPWTSAAGNVGSFNAVYGYGTTGNLPTWWTGAMTSSGTMGPYASTNGNWGNGVNFSQKKWMGFRMEIPVSSGDYYYGWARISTGTSPKMGSITVHGWALSDEANTAAFAGIVTSYADSANAITVADVSDNDGAADLGVTFSLADTANTGELRVYAVPAGGDTLEACDAWGILQTGSYMTVPLNAATGTFDYSIDFTGQTDINGAAIVNGSQYYVYVYSKGNFHSITNPTGANQSSLVKSTNSVTLMGKAEPVTAIGASDISDNGDASDLEVTFTEPATDISKQSSYKVFVVKSGNTFNNDTANAVLAGNYKTESATSTSDVKTINYTAGDKDSDGDSIVACTEYVVYVQSIANQTTADRDTLIGPSSAIELKGIVLPVLNITASDILDNGDGSDYEFSFDAPAEVSGISFYKAFCVPTASLPFTLADVATNANFVFINNNASPSYTYTFSGKMDTDNNAIVNGTDYTVVIASLNNGNCVDRDTIITASAGLTLSTIVPPTVDNITISGVDVADDNLPSDMEVTFTRPSGNMDHVGQFHIVVVNSINASFFQGTTNGEAAALTAAEDLKKDGFLTSVSPSDSASDGTYTVRLATHHADEFGNKIRNYRAYNIFILTEGDGTFALSNTLSDSSDAVILRDFTGLESELDSKVTINSFENNVRIVLDPSTKLAGTVAIHNSLGQIIHSENITGREMMFNNITSEKGVYFVTVVIGSEKITKKVFIQ